MTAVPVVVDLLEIGSLPGYLALRASAQTGAPVSLLLPAPAAMGMVDNMLQLAHQADDDYATLTRIAGSDGARAVAATIDAPGLLADAVRGDTHLSLGTARGHVVITAFPPFTTAPAVLAVPPPLLIINTDALTTASTHATHTLGTDRTPPEHFLTDMTSWDWPPQH